MEASTQRPTPTALRVVRGGHALAAVALVMLLATLAWDVARLQAAADRHLFALVPALGASMVLALDLIVHVPLIALAVVLAARLRPGSAWAWWLVVTTHPFAALALFARGFTSGRVAFVVLGAWFALVALYLMTPPPRALLRGTPAAADAARVTPEP